MLTNRLAGMLPAWIGTVEASQLPGLTGFARHVCRDLDAVTAGLSLEWRSGGTEGTVNRKKIKRQSYSRAVDLTFDQAMDHWPLLTLLA
ncbi:hypothetical protein PV416_40320 [Streptomyces ipomoeae]|uniref:hypothetical protein n=1 Tax=Streptomyces ipomoeae TaxID=103232 RepID=UPI0015F05243|nr:hypothetical protein [Streptomyces ipomoeae]MDX2827142.1 hypothetical protein [Streptomyces ipomoeae]MDX2879757.1 hypothetical protein [Streptomyces ipomoeae]